MMPAWQRRERISLDRCIAAMLYRAAFEAHDFMTFNALTDYEMEQFYRATEALMLLHLYGPEYPNCPPFNQVKVVIDVQAQEA